jgi:PAS domain S-box-containing protein
MTTGKPGSTASAFRQVASLLAIVAGGIVLVGWAFDTGVLKSILPGALAMKPNTALAFILVGLALRFASLRSSRFGATVPQLCTLGAGLIGLFTLAEYVFAWNPGFDQWLFREPAGAPGTSHPGRMAPDTALCFVLLAVALAASRRPVKFRSTLIASVALGSLVTGVSLAALLTALTPEFQAHGWWGLTIMAPVTATLFGALGATLVVEQWQEASLRWKWPFAFATVTLLLWMGVWYYRAEVNRIRAATYEEIAAIGELKAGQILLWRRERMNDATRMAGGPLVRKAVAEFLREPGCPLRADLLERLRIERTAGGYADALIFAPDGKLLLAAHATPAPPTPATQRLVASALASPEAVLSDFFRLADGTIHIAVTAVVRDTAGLPLAVAVLRSDAATYLFPLIQSWPTPSRSGETFIVQREGDFVVWLNEARHRAGTALALRQPVTRTEIPAVQAALGRRGMFEGVDYRGEPVLADLRPVAGSPWFMVAKVDQAEIFDEARSRTRLIMLAFGSLILLAATVTAFLYRQEHAAEAVRFNAYNRNLIEASLDPLVTISAEGKITDVNEASVQATGVPREQLIGTDFSDYFTEPERARAGYRQVFSEGFVRDYPLSIRHTLGRVMEVLYNASVYNDEQGRVLGVFAAARDITSLRRAEESLRQLNASLEQRVRERTAELTAANQELESFSYAVSHDLRAPLRAMCGFSQALVEDHGAALPEEARGYLEQITRASRHMSELVDGLLTLSRCTRGELRREAVDLSALCERICGELARAEPERRVERRIQPGLVAHGDPRMMEVVMSNLLGNAWKYTGRQPAPVIRFYAETADGRPWFCVADNGAGFDMQHAGQLFQPFQRLHRQDEFPGIGIGLATVQRILHRHGGTIHATAAVGRGATFKFSLPEPETKDTKTS